MNLDHGVATLTMNNKAHVLNRQDVLLPHYPEAELRQKSCFDNLDFSYYTILLRDVVH
jgi:hypothetical protein